MKRRITSLALALCMLLCLLPVTVLAEDENTQWKYQETPTEVTTLLGDNNIWADTGNIKLLKYYEDNAAVFHDEIYDYLNDYKTK